MRASVDCGGNRCGPCAISKACIVDSDCVSDVCAAGKCVESACFDGVRDNGEADVDCGHACGSRTCATGSWAGGSSRSTSV